MANTSLHRIQFLLISFILLCVLFTTPIVASHDVVSVSLTVVNVPDSQTNSDVYITLWFKSMVYRYTIQPNEIGTTYTTSISDMMTYCETEHFGVSDTRIMIENNAGDAVCFDEIAFHTSSGEWYGIQGRCFDDALEAVQGWMHKFSGWQDATVDDVDCESGVSNVWLCIDNEKDDCEPYKQIFYFDINRTKEYINDAKWKDGTNDIPNFETCSPTSDPTVNPSAEPTNLPSTQPTYLPTKLPSIQPSYLPTNQPSNIPTLRPLPRPTLNINLVPSVHPSAAVNPSILYTTSNMMHDSTEEEEEQQNEPRESVDIIAVALVALIALLCIVIVVVLAYTLKVRYKDPKKGAALDHMVVKEDENKQMSKGRTEMICNDVSTLEVFDDQNVVNEEGVTSGIQPDEFIIEGDDNSVAKQTSGNTATGM